MSGFYLDYNIDVVFCIDATGSIKEHSDKIKKSVLLASQKISNFIIKMDSPKDLSQFRVRVIAFRDIEIDDEPIIQSRFFTLDEEYDALSEFLDSIEFVGGGCDAPESALEALALAMKSDWDQTGARRRHVIVMCTDAPAKPLGSGSDKPTYPADMPKDMAELKDWWNGKYMYCRDERMIILAPDSEPWCDMEYSDDWHNVFHFTVQGEYKFNEQDNHFLMRILFDVF